MKILRELRKLKNFNLIDFAVPIIDILCPVKYSPNGKYDNRYFFTCLIDLLDTGVSFNKYKGTHEFLIRGKYLNEIHNKYIKRGVYDQIQKEILTKYLKTDRESKLKYQIIDSTFIANKQGSIKGNDHLLSNEEKHKNELIRKQNKYLPKNKQQRENHFIDFNRYNGRKKYNKVDMKVDPYGIPLSVSISPSKRVDSKTLKDVLNSIPINLNTLRNSKINRYKQYVLLDSNYDTKKNHKLLKKKGYIPLIRYNKRNCRDPIKNAKRKFKGKEKKIYKKRPIIEISFSWLKNRPIINQNYEKTIPSYLGLFKLACIVLTSTRI